MSSTLNLPRGDVTSTLPQELIDDIVDYVPDDEETQKHLSLVNRSWSHRTRHHLFQTVRFELGGRSCTLLNEVLRTNPSLYQHIQTMRIDHGSRFNLQTSSILGVIDPKQLVNVRGISIHGDTESCLHWSTLPAGLRSALYNLLGKPDLITLTLMDIRDIDVSFIGRSRRLKELTLYGVKHSLSSSPSISSDGPPATRLADEKCSLRSLSVGQCGDALQCLRATTVVPQPVALKVYSGRYDEKMDMVLQVFSRNVETYEIQCHGPSGFLTGPGMIGHLPLHSGVLDFARLPKLKTLRIRLQLNQLWYLLSGLTPSLGQQIARLRSTNCLEDIDIVLELDEILHYWMRSRLDETLHPLFDPAWTDLDNTLGDKDAFSKLKKLRIWLKIPTHVVHSKEELASRFSVFKETVMPNLTRRGILEVVH